MFTFLGVFFLPALVGGTQSASAAAGLRCYAGNYSCTTNCDKLHMTDKNLTTCPDDGHEYVCQELARFPVSSGKGRGLLKNHSIAIPVWAFQQTYVRGCVKAAECSGQTFGYNSTAADYWADYGGDADLDEIYTPHITCCSSLDEDALEGINTGTYTDGKPLACNGGESIGATSGWTAILAAGHAVIWAWMMAAQ